MRRIELPNGRAQLTKGLLRRAPVPRLVHVHWFGAEDRGRGARDCVLASEKELYLRLREAPPDLGWREDRNRALSVVQPTPARSAARFAQAVTPPSPRVAHVQVAPVASAAPSSPAPRRSRASSSARGRLVDVPMRACTLVRGGEGRSSRGPHPVDGWPAPSGDTRVLGSPEAGPMMFIPAPARPIGGARP